MPNVMISNGGIQEIDAPSLRRASRTQAALSEATSSRREVEVRCCTSPHASHMRSKDRTCIEGRPTSTPTSREQVHSLRRQEPSVLVIPLLTHYHLSSCVAEMLPPPRTRSAWPWRWSAYDSKRIRYRSSMPLGLCAVGCTILPGHRHDVCPSDARSSMDRVSLLRVVGYTQCGKEYEMRKTGEVE
jgi:hypothetical protein